jgi:DNA-binding NtrC family response regulator
MKKILLVDDEKIILETLGENLKDAGYNLTSAENGGEAIARLKKENYDLIVTDLVMEGIDGIQLLTAAKEINPDIPVIILTGYGAAESAVDAMRLGADDYLLKPCSLDELLMRISRCIEMREIKKMTGIYESLLHVCPKCKKIRGGAEKKPGKGEWMSLEDYIKGKSMSQTYCDECGKKAKKE